MEIADRHGLAVVEDAAQGIFSTYKGRQLGSIGAFGALSFHETKNIISGEGGALLVNSGQHVERAEVIREKGTNRSKFFRGQVDKYTWVDIGSSYLPCEIIAAFLVAQLEEADDINRRRMAIWERYDAWAAPLEQQGLLRRPIVPEHCGHNAHMYYLLLPSLESRARYIEALKNQGISAVFHYIPLHSSPAGQRYGRTAGSMQVTDDTSDRLVRMPLWIGLEDVMDEVLQAADGALIAAGSVR
jgi:Predicted pyridoxal phosphate-dependent enzyme apparently involved in regulation of cell wall biogenesis